MTKTLIALSLLAAPTTAIAQPQQGASVRVAYADLDLSQPSGRRKLDQRLAAALDKVCPSARPGYLTPAPQARYCRALSARQIATARAEAVARQAGVIRVSAVR